MQPARPNKILLVRYSALGDVIQTLPVLSMLRDAFPEAKIGWAIDTELAPLVEGHLALDYLHRCSRKTWAKAIPQPRQWATTIRDMKRFVDEVRAVNYDVALDAQGLFKTALLPMLAGIKRRVGYKHGREFSSIFYTEQHVRRREYFDPAIFHLEHMATLARSIGAGELHYRVQPPAITPESRERVRRLIQEAFDPTLSPRTSERMGHPATPPIVALAPATQWTSKHWPEEYWSTLVARLLAETDLNLLFHGAPADSKLVERILARVPQLEAAGRVANLCGRLPVTDLYALHEQVQAAIGPDSAPLHIAGAVGVPALVGIYGPTGYRRTPPIGSAQIKLLSSEGQLQCQPCHKRVCPLGTGECMLRVQPGEVFDALLGALAGAGVRVELTRATTVT